MKRVPRLAWSLAILATTTLNLACGGGGEGTTGDSPGQVLPNKASVHFVVDYPATGTGSCGLTTAGGMGSGEGNVPDLPTSTTPPIYFGVAVEDGQPFADGTGAYEVDCRVAGDGAYQIEVKMAGQNNSPLAPSEVGAVSFEIAGNIGADGQGAASLKYRTVKTGMGYNETSVPCTLSAIPDAVGGTGVGAGLARFSFSCLNTLQVLQDLSRCDVSGTVAVFDCSQ